MDVPELLLHTTSVLESLGIEYRIVGSIASIAYGEPRFTNYVDIIVRLRLEHVKGLLKVFSPPEFYCSEQAMVHAIHRKFQFNVIHPASGLKVDFIVVSDSEFDQSRFRRGKRQLIDQVNEAWFASSEDVILKKLVYFHEGGSEKHLRDVAGILKVQAGKTETEYLEHWVAALGVEEEWQLVQERLKRQ